MLNLKYKILKTPPRVFDTNGVLVVFDKIPKSRHIDEEIFYTKFGRIGLELVDEKHKTVETYISKIPYKTMKAELDLDEGRCFDEKRNVLQLKNKSIYNPKDEQIKYYKVYR